MGCASLRLDVRRSDHFAPLLGFVGDELSEVGRRAWKHGAAQVSEPSLDLGIGESGVELVVELVNDLGGRVPGGGGTPQAARHVGAHALTHSGGFRACRRTHCTRYGRSRPMSLT